MACDLYALHTRSAQVQLNSMPSTFVICPTQNLAFPFALSVQMLCSYIPIGLIFRLDLEFSILGFLLFYIGLSRSVITVCLCVSCMQVSLMSCRSLCAADRLLQHVCGVAHASACFR